MLLTYPIVTDETKLSKEKAAELYALNEGGSTGFYPVGTNNFWHGGVHFESEAPVRSIADGTIIAYRINRVPLECEIRAYSKLPHHVARGFSLINAAELEKFALDEWHESSPSEAGVATHYSNGFVLVRHEYLTPKGHKIEFHCLYMHLLPLSYYTEQQGRHVPSIFDAKRYVVRSAGDGGGLELHAMDDPAKVIGTIPWHFRFKKVPNAEPKTYKGVKLELVEFNTMSGYAATRNAAHLEGDFYLQTISKKAKLNDSILGLNVREGAKDSAPVLRIVPRGERLFFKRAVEKGKYNETIDGGFVWVDDQTIESSKIIEPEAWDTVVPSEAKVKRGEIIGYPGPYITSPSMLHFEIFLNEPPANRQGEHWGPANFVIPAGTRFMKKEPDENPNVQVDLPVGVSLDVIERAGEYLKVSATLPTVGWALRSKLGRYDGSSKSYVLEGDLDALSLVPGPAEGGSRKPIDARQGASLRYLEKEKGDYRLVGFGSPTKKEGWQNPPALPNARTGTFELETAVPTLLEKDPTKAFKFTTLAGVSTDEVIGREYRDLMCVTADGVAWMEVEYAPGQRGWIRPEGPGVARKSDYDWPGWKVVSEPEATGDDGFSKDGFCDIADLIALYERDYDARISLAEIKQVLRTPGLAARLRRTIVKHPTEWDSSSDDARNKWKRLKGLPWLMSDSLFEDTVKHIRAMQWYGAVRGLPAAGSVCHVHPIAFIEHLKELHGITAAQLRELFPLVWLMPHVAVPSQETIDKFLLPLNEAMQRYGITSRLRQCHFLGQIRIESNLHFLEEEGEAAHTDERFPPPFWGRGLLQVTYKDNYRTYNQYRVNVLGKPDPDLLNNPNKLRDDPELAADSAGWYWSVFRSINPHCDAEQVDDVSKLVNYGSTRIDITKIHHYQERRDYTTHAENLLMR